MTELDRHSTKAEELRLLAEAAKEHPELFEKRSYIEDDIILGEFGIVIPDKKAFPEGYLKLWPQDFIVEEIMSDGNVATVTRENILDSEIILEQGSTTFATLVKCGLSTIEVVEYLAKQLGCDRKAIGYAGIKDKDALTSQRISFRKVSLQKLKNVSSSYFFLKDVVAGKGVVATADLQGNRFTVLVRTEQSFFETASFENFVENLKTVQQHGFANFFYLQRFGTPRLANYHWGLSILKGDYRQAVYDTLTFPAEREQPYFRALRQMIADDFGNWEQVHEILAPFPIIFRHEIKIVQYLQSHPDDFVGALNQIPDQISLWVYALASRYFNEAISSYQGSDRPLPETLPLLLSFNKSDWQPYETSLKRDGIYPPPFQNLRPFPFIQMRPRSLPTTDRATILGVEAVEQGLILSFELNKGQYATTFLSHLFNLISGLPPEYLVTEPGDIKEPLGEASIKDTLDYFAPIIHSKIENASETTTEIG